jgi:hypothetical protein
MSVLGYSAYGAQDAKDRYGGPTDGGMVGTMRRYGSNALYLAMTKQTSWTQQTS